MSFYRIYLLRNLLFSSKLLKLLAYPFAVYGIHSYSTSFIYGVCICRSVFILLPSSLSLLSSLSPVPPSFLLYLLLLLSFLFLILLFSSSSSFSLSLSLSPWLVCPEVYQLHWSYIMSLGFHCLSGFCLFLILPVSSWTVLFLSYTQFTFKHKCLKA